MLPLALATTPSVEGSGVRLRHREAALAAVAIQRKPAPRSHLCPLIASLCSQ